MRTKERVYSKEAQLEIADYIINALKDGRADDIYAGDLHHELFNTDYYIIGTYEAKQWINKSMGDAFIAVDFVQDYEKQEFGETYTDISDAEKVCNMCAYIIGNEILNDLNSFQNCWDKNLTKENIDEIIEELILKL